MIGEAVELRQSSVPVMITRFTNVKFLSELPRKKRLLESDPEGSNIYRNRKTKTFNSRGVEHQLTPPVP